MDLQEFETLGTSYELVFAGAVETGEPCDRCGRPPEPPDRLYRFTISGHPALREVRLDPACVKAWQTAIGEAYVRGLDYSQQERARSNLLELGRWNQVPYREALRLVESGEWLFEGELSELIREEIDRILGVLLADPELAERVLVPNEIPWEIDPEGTPGGPNRVQYVLPNRLTVLHALRDAVREVADELTLDPDTLPRRQDDPLLSGLYIWGGTIVKVGPTFKALRLPLLGLIGALLTVTESESLLPLIGTGLTTLPNLKEIVGALATAVERLEGEELFVVESIFVLTVLNKEKPTVQEIAEAITSGHPSLAQPPAEWRDLASEALKTRLTDILNELRRSERSILQEEGGRWTIVF